MRVGRFAFVGVVIAVFVSVAYAGAATTPSPLGGIGAAARPQTARDLLPHNFLVRLMRRPPRQSAVTRNKTSIVPASSRLLRQLPTGAKLYVAASKANGLDVVLITSQPGQSSAGGWLVAFGRPLSSTHPVTVGSMGVGSTPPISYGVALNGVASVSFKASGRMQTVSVEGNVWFYVGQASAFQSITVHYADGHTRTIKH